MALVIVRAPLRHARQHRQDRLCTVERLDLALLVDAEHQRAVRRRQIEAYDVADLVHEVRIARQLERLRSGAAASRRRAHMRQIVVCERPLSLAIERNDQWVASAGVALQRPLDNLGHLLVRERSRPSRTRLIRKSVDALLQEAAAPLADRVLVHAEFDCHRLIGQAVCAAQDHAAAIGQRARDPAASSLTLKIRPILIAQNQGRHRPANATCHRKDLHNPTPMAIV